VKCNGLDKDRKIDSVGGGYILSIIIHSLSVGVGFTFTRNHLINTFGLRSSSP